MGEFSFIDWICRQQSAGVGVVTPAGDDMAVVRFGGEDLVLAAVDQVIDGVHFDSARHSPQQIGKKVMNRNLSDCAAMACLPAFALACVALPEGLGESYAKALYLGMKEAADRFQCAIVGGDTGSWQGKLVASVTILGRSAGIMPIHRSGAKPGDSVYLTGPLGGSLLGRHMDFQPRINEAREFARHYQITSMIDISDGLWRDLGHICDASKVGARIEAGAVPIHEDARTLGQRDGREPLLHALHDGEDHELAFTSPDQISAVTKIGVITDEKGMVLLSGGVPRNAGTGGWEHAL